MIKKGDSRYKTKKKEIFYHTEPPPEVGERIWEKWPAENSKQYRAFSLYRDMGVDRSMRQVAYILRKNSIRAKDPGAEIPFPKSLPRYVYEWATAYMWTERVRAFDEYMFKEQEKQWFERQKALRAQQWEASETLFGIGLEALKHIDVDELEPKDIAKFLDLASKMGIETRQEPLTTDYIKLFLQVLPEQLRDQVVLLLKSPEGGT